MHRPSGVPAAHPKRHLEDDQTYVPPAMSAFALAILNRTESVKSESKMPLSHENNNAVTWERRENPVLKESLERKLSEQLNNSLSSASSGVAISSHSLLKSPAALHTRSSFGSSSATGATGLMSNFSNGSHEGPTTPSRKNSYVSARLSGAFDRSLHNNTFDAVDPHTTGQESGNISHHSKSWSEDSAAKRHSSARSSTSSENGSVLSAGFPKITGNAGTSPVSGSADMSNPNSSSSATNQRALSIGFPGRKSRMRRVFKTLVPPTRPSDVNANISNSSLVDRSNQGLVATPPKSLEYKTASPSSSHKNDDRNQNENENENRVGIGIAKNPTPRGQISSQSDFFKSLKTLRETSPNPFNGNGNGISPKTDFRPHKLRPVSPHGSLSRPDGSLNSNPGRTGATALSVPNTGISNPPNIRPPLQDVSREYLNVEHGVSANGFKKPRIPGAPPKVSHTPGPDMRIVETPAVQKDPTPQLQSKIAVSDLERPRTSHSDDDGRRKVIRVNNNEYEKLEVIGKGGTSKVYKVRSLQNRKPYALKKVSFSQFDESCVNAFKGEIELLQKLRGEVRVVSLMDHAASSGSMYLLMECGDIDLAHVLQNKLQTDSKLDTNFVRFHASEVFHCIQAVHNAGIVHSDLKPANFLFVGGILKIIDFGIANALPDYTVNIYRQSQIGTPNYMAPEALVEVNHTRTPANKSESNTWRVGFPSDVWSCGCIIYQMVYGRPPYASYSGQQRILAIMNPQVQVQYPEKGLGGVAVPSSAIELIQHCLERDPKDRWTVEECLDSNFIKPRAVSQTVVRDLLHSAVDLGRQRPHPGSLDDATYSELVGTILQQIKDLNIA